MAAFVTDQFRILNAGSFVESISNNSYYAFLGLANPTATGFGRTDTWNTSTTNNPVDNFQHLSHYRDTSLFGKKITEQNARRVIKKIEWIEGTAYDMYRHDYGQYAGNQNLAIVSKALRLYDAKYYVITSEFKIYICIENGTTGDSATAPTSTIEPNHTDVEPVEYSDGYRWKYLFKISPSDVIKFDSTEFIVVPNSWETSTENEIKVIRDGGDSNLNNNQIKTVFIDQKGANYANGDTADIIGDGTGGKVSITTDNLGSITKVTVTQGGKGYTYGYCNFPTPEGNSPAKLIPIIPPSRGHGYNIYQELGTDKVLLYARFDDSTKDFPVDTKFAQVGIIKNPETFSGVGVTFTENSFSSLFSAKLTESVPKLINGTSIIGLEITQTQSDGSVAKGYVASFDEETNVLKYYQDRSLSFGNSVDQTQNNDSKPIVSFDNSESIKFSDSINRTVDISFEGSSILVNSKQINLGVSFTGGLANPEINKKTGDIIYIDNRPEVQRDTRQKEDVKIILEF